MKKYGVVPGSSLRIRRSEVRILSSAPERFAWVSAASIGDKFSVRVPTCTLTENFLSFLAATPSKALWYVSWQRMRSLSPKGESSRAHQSDLLGYLLRQSAINFQFEYLRVHSLKIFLLSLQLYQAKALWYVLGRG